MPCSSVITVSQSVHSNRTKISINEGTSQIQWWEHQIDGSQQSMELLAVGLGYSVDTLSLWAGGSEGSVNTFLKHSPGSYKDVRSDIEVSKERLWRGLKIVQEKL